MKTCGDCRYLSKNFDDGEDMGECRRYPATIIVYPGGVSARFPMAIRACGEFKPRDDDSEAK